MISYFVTTGISLGLSRCWKRPDGQVPAVAKWDSCKSFREILELPDRALAIESIQSLTDAVLASLGSDPDQYKGRALASVRQWFRFECWSDPLRMYLLPAELATLRALEGELNRGATLKILHGEGDIDGSNAREATLLWAVLQLLKDEGHLLASCELSEPFSWAPTSLAAFSGGMDKLWAYVRASLPDVRFVLSGGYKVVLLEIMRRIVEEEISTEIYYLQEGNLDLIRIGTTHGKIVSVEQRLGGAFE